MSDAVGRLREQLAPLVARLAEEPPVHAVTIVGSQQSGTARPGSDIDLFVYVDDTPQERLLEMRAAVADDLADRSKLCVIGQVAHPYADVWVVRGTDVLLDVMFWTQLEAEAELDSRLVKMSPQVGYSTALWRSIRDGIPLFERGDWHRELQQRAASPYPDVLRERIIALNRNLLGRENPFSFFNKVANAIDEADPVAVQHLVAKWLVSYFDVLFAANRVLHAGEKRLVTFASRECERLPNDFERDAESLVRVSCDPSPAIVNRMDVMLERLDAVATAPPAQGMRGSYL